MYSEILKKNLIFVNIKNVFISEEGDKLLEFNIWEEVNEKMSFSVYRFLLPIDEAFEVLKLVFKKRIPSNYYIFEMKDQEVLARITIEDSKIRLNKKENCGLIHLKFELEKDCFNNIIYKLLDEGAYIKVEEDKKVNLANLVFNRKNLNINLRYYIKEYGFKTVSLHNIFARNIVVYTSNELNLPYCLKSKKIENIYETPMNLDATELPNYIMYIDDNPKAFKNSAIQLDNEFIIYILSKMYYNQVKSKFMNSLDLYFKEKEIDYTKRESRTYETDNFKVCDSEPYFKIPSQKLLFNLMKEFNLKENRDWKGFLKLLKEHLEIRVVNIIEDLIRNLQEFKSPTLEIKIDIMTKEYQREFAKSGLVAHALKSTLYLDSSTNMYYSYGKKGGLHLSTIFNSSVIFATYPKI